MKETHIAEVIESNTTEIIAQCKDLHCSPPFGSFVKVKPTLSPVEGANSLIYGLVFNVMTNSIEPNRRAVAYGKTEEELRNEQPQIFELLKTEFQAHLVGYQDRTGIKQILPSQPPRIHSFVYTCSLEEVREFTRQSDYLRTLFTISRVPPDELVIATIRNSLEAHAEDSQQYLIQVGKELARLLRDDYDRLSSILRRIAP
jgi:hypothetical protein